MSKRAKRGLAASAVLAVLAGLGIYAVVASGRTTAGAQTLPDAGKFRSGSGLGEERAGFSGRSKVLVFTSAADPEWPTIEACLQTGALEAELGRFTGVLVDPAAEPEVEAALRERAGFRVVVRSLNGAFLGGLPAGWGCQELVELLRSIRGEAAGDPERSPIYANLLESTAAIDALLLEGAREKAERFVGLLEEFEGPESPAVQAARARLGR